MTYCNLSKRKTILIFLLFLIAISAQANGVRDSAKRYEFAIVEKYESLLKDVFSAKLAAVEAKETLARMRIRYNQEYDERSGILDALIDAVAEKRMTKEEAMHQFSALMEKEIIAYNEAKSTAERSRQGDSRNQGENGSRQGNNGNNPQGRSGPSGKGHN